MTEDLRETLRWEAKSLLRLPRSGMLATLRASAPFASLTTFATDYDGSPIFLLSRLAIHTQNLDADPRCSLLLPRIGKGDPLAHSRLTVSGKALRTDAPLLRTRLLARFLARQPKAALYAGFADFGLFKMTLDDIHLNGGFARAADFTPDEILTPVANPEHWANQEPQVLEFLNGNGADLLRAAQAKSSGTSPSRWRASGIDPEGIDLVHGEDNTRLPVTIDAIDNISLQARLKALSI